MGLFSGGGGWGSMARAMEIERGTAGERRMLARDRARQARDDAAASRHIAKVKAEQKAAKKAASKKGK